MSDETKTTRPNAAGQPSLYQLHQESLRAQQELIRLLSMKHPGETSVRWDLMRLGKEAADARVAEAIANAEAQRLRDRDRFRNNIAFVIGILAILFLLAAPTIRWWNQHGQPALALATAPIGIVWNVGTSVATHWVCQSGLLHPQTRYEVCPRPVYAPLPAPVAQPQPQPAVQKEYVYVRPWPFVSLSRDAAWIVGSTYEYMGDGVFKAEGDAPQYYFVRYLKNAPAYDCMGSTKLKIGQRYMITYVEYALNEDYGRETIARIVFEQLGVCR